jgi:glycosyltransferase involved in cell wall biosynthesis
MAREIRTLSGRAAGVHVIPNGVWLDEYVTAPPASTASLGDLEQRRFLLAIGRLVPEKGFDVLLRALARSRAHDVGVALAGEGEARPALERLATELGLAERVRVLGYVDGTRKTRLLHRCLALTCPSTWAEPFGLVLLEAFASGRAVIGSAVGGIAEVVRDGETGLLVPPGDHCALAAAIDSIALDAGRRSALEARVRVEAARYAWPEIARRHIEVYERALAGASA